MGKARLKKRPGKAAILMGLLAVLVLAHVVSACTLDRSIEYKEVPFHSSRVLEELDGYRLAFITDTHQMTVEEFEAVARKLNTSRLDLLLLGGDFSSYGEKLQRSMEILSGVVTTDGIYGVEGNHDSYIELFAAMERYGIHPLSNSGVQIREHLYLAGVEDLWNRAPDVEEATRAAEPDDFVLLLSHNPDVTMMQDMTSVDLVLSGHTHGGQITFLGLWAPDLTLRKTITKYGQRFMSGWAKSHDGVPVYVSNGTGHLSSVPRIFARPQVILMTLLLD